MQKHVIKASMLLSAYWRRRRPALHKYPTNQNVQTQETIGTTQTIELPGFTVLWGDGKRRYGLEEIRLDGVRVRQINYVISVDTRRNSSSSQPVSCRADWRHRRLLHSCTALHTHKHTQPYTRMYTQTYNYRQIYTRDEING